MTYLLVADRDGESAGRSNVGRDRAGNDNDREDRTIWTVPTSFPSLRDTERDAAARALISATDLPEYAFSLSHHLPPIMIPTAPPQPYRYIHLGRCDAASLDVGTYARWFGAEELRDVKHPAWVRGLIERAADVIGDTPGLGKESEGEGGREHDGMVGYGEDD
ncbi:hypothetical protein HK101_001906 [Irineochytrium annulatum]|nr:hypothetical protein HK101_001906 [Irineochytrium annulatum]